MLSLCLLGSAASGASPNSHWSPACERLIEAATLQAQHGPRCLVTSAVSAAAAHGVAIDALELARAVPLYPDGADIFDLQEALGKSGLRTLTFQTTANRLAGSAQTIGQLVAAGWPVIAMVHRRAGKHAVVVRGVRHAETPGGCTKEATNFQIMDPAHGTLRWTKAAKFEEQLFSGQVLVLQQPKPGAEAPSPAIDWASARRQNARFRAQALVRRALEHDPLNRQSLSLVTRAVAEDPCWMEARELHQQLIRTLPSVAYKPLPTCSARQGGK